MSEFQSSEDRIQYLSQKTIPSALETLSKRHQSLTQVVQYLEGGYLSAPENKRHIIENEANEYLVNALSSVAMDISCAAASLDQLMELNGNAIDSLTNQVQLLHTRLRMSREMVARQNLQDSRVGFKPDSGIATRAVEVDAEVHENISYANSNMMKRLAQLDDLGVCLNKSTSIATTTTGSFSNEARIESVRHSVGGADPQLSMQSDQSDISRSVRTHNKYSTARQSLLASRAATDGHTDTIKPPSL